MSWPVKREKTASTATRLVIQLLPTRTPECIIEGHKDGRNALPDFLITPHQRVTVLVERESPAIRGSLCARCRVPGCRR